VSEALRRLSYMRLSITGGHATEQWPVALGYGPWIEKSGPTTVERDEVWRQAARLELGADAAGDNVRFWVTDNDPG